MKPVALISARRLLTVGLHCVNERIEELEPFAGKCKEAEERVRELILAVGLQPPAQSAELARMMGIELNAHGFCETDKFQPLQTSQPGVYVAGAFQSPKEIAETVFDAAGAAGEVMRVFHDELGGTTAPRAFPFLGNADGMPPERDVSGETPRTGVFLCGCGPVVSQSMDLQGTALEQTSTLQVTGSFLWDEVRGVMTARQAAMDGRGTVRVSLLPAPVPMTFSSRSRARLIGD